MDRRCGRQELGIPTTGPTTTFGRQARTHTKAAPARSGSGSWYSRPFSRRWCWRCPLRLRTSEAHCRSSRRSWCSSESSRSCSRGAGARRRTLRPTADEPSGRHRRRAPGRCGERPSRRHRGVVPAGLRREGCDAAPQTNGPDTLSGAAASSQGRPEVHPFDQRGSGGSRLLDEARPLRESRRDREGRLGEVAQSTHHEGVRESALGAMNVLSHAPPPLPTARAHLRPVPARRRDRASAVLAMRPDEVTAQGHRFSVR